MNRQISGEGWPFHLTFIIVYNLRLVESKAML